jgi:hypothetical protein
MDNETKQIINSIADIQIEALQRIKQNENKPNASLSRDLVLKFLGFEEDSEDTLEIRRQVHEVIDQRIDTYRNIKEYPYLIKMLSEYQLFMCSHILFNMEDTWILDNAQGVQGAWSLIKEAIHKFRPEFSLLFG